MTDLQINDQAALRLGEAWIQAILDKDFQRLNGLCQPDIRSQLLTPHHVYTFDHVPDLTRKVEQWFSACDPIQKEQSRIAMVGEKLAVFYRLSLRENGDPYILEQQIYCSLRDGRIDQLRLLCSGFQAVEALLQTPISQPTSPKAHALLTVETGAGQESTCAILTPAIKRKLKEIDSGEVLEVRVDDPAARGDIEAWCRLSGNTLLNLDLMNGQELHFYLMKK